MTLPQEVFFNCGLKIGHSRPALVALQRGDDGCLTTEQGLARRTVSLGIPGFSGRQ